MNHTKLTPVALLLGGLALTPAVAAPDGQKIATQGQGGVPCQACHGLQGQGNDAGGFPRLAGLDADYLARQLRDFKNGSRQSPVMAPQATPLDDAAIQAVSDYYAGLKPPAGQAPTPPPDQLVAGQQLAEVGRWSDTIPACVQCHGPAGRGIGSHFPALAGQHPSYIAGQIKAWQQGTRSNDPNGLMASVAKRLTDADAQAVAAWFASLPAPVKEAAK